MSNKSISNNVKFQAKTKVKVMKLRTLHQSDVELAEEPDVQVEHFVLLTVSVGKSPSEFVIHRPVGVTDVGSENWIISPKADFQLLLTRAHDPDQEKLKTKRYAWLLTAATKVKILTRGADGLWRYPSGRVRDVALTEARAAAKATGKAGTKSAPADPLFFLSDQERVEENVLREFLRNPENVRKAEEELPQTYRTMGGSFNDRPQVPIPFLVGKKLDNAQDALNQYILGASLFKPP